MPSKPFSLQAASALCALCLATAAAQADTVSIITNAAVDVLGPLQDPVGPATSGTAESFVEQTSSGQRVGMASALADDKGNIEVGVELAMGWRGVASALSLFTTRIHNPETEFMEALIHFTVLPGELLFKDTGNFDLPTLPGRYSGQVGYASSVTSGTGEITPFSDCQIGIDALSKTWGYAANTTPCGQSLVSQIFLGDSDLWGVSTKQREVNLLVGMQPGETISVTYSMFARAESRFLDWPGLFSVKFGDPLDATVGSGFSVTFQPVTHSVPSPASAALAALAVLALAATRRAQRRGRPTRPSTAAAPSRRASAAGSGAAHPA